jgi:hypothetical protein
LLAETAALVVAIVGATLTSMLTTNQLVLIAVSAYGASASYYGVLLGHAFITNRRDHPETGHHTMIGMLRGLILDFGSAEILDSLLFSPLLLYLCLRMLPNLQIAVVLSELASTAAFYTAVLGARAARKALA